MHSTPRQPATRGSFFEAFMEDVIKRLGVNATPDTIRAVIADAVRYRPKPEAPAALLTFLRIRFRNWSVSFIGMKLLFLSASAVAAVLLVNSAMRTPNAQPPAPPQSTEAPVIHRFFFPRQFASR